MVKKTVPVNTRIMELNILENFLIRSFMEKVDFRMNWVIFTKELSITVSTMEKGT